MAFQIGTNGLKSDVTSASVTTDYTSVIDCNADDANTSEMIWTAEGLDVSIMEISTIDTS